MLKKEIPLTSSFIALAQISSEFQHVKWCHIGALSEEHLLGPWELFISRNTYPWSESVQPPAWRIQGFFIEANEWLRVRFVIRKDSQASEAIEYKKLSFLQMLLILTYPGTIAMLLSSGHSFAHATFSPLYHSFTLYCAELTFVIKLPLGTLTIFEESFLKHNIDLL